MKNMKPALVLLCGLAVLGQSRGWLFTAPVAGVAFVALVPQRVRTSLTLALVLAATGAVEVRWSPHTPCSTASTSCWNWSRRASQGSNDVTITGPCAAEWS